MHPLMKLLLKGMSKLLKTLVNLVGLKLNDLSDPLPAKDALKENIETIKC
jgi:hypothetical protein